MVTSTSWVQRGDARDIDDFHVADDNDDDEDVVDEWGV